mmetsp:Transcript_52527/g.163059  ORF Transcript_52527/g.163059 Transcript_52527/m.163059 type:complete len:224 (-) Transcript_52527:1151-1822(-)
MRTRRTRRSGSSRPTWTLKETRGTPTSNSSASGSMAPRPRSASASAGRSAASCWWTGSCPRASGPLGCCEGARSRGCCKPRWPSRTACPRACCACAPWTRGAWPSGSSSARRPAGSPTRPRRRPPCGAAARRRRGLLASERSRSSTAPGLGRCSGPARSSASPRSSPRRWAACSGCSWPTAGAGSSTDSPGPRPSACAVTCPSAASRCWTATWSRAARSTSRS